MIFRGICINFQGQLIIEDQDAKAMKSKSKIIQVIQRITNLMYFSRSLKEIGQQIYVSPNLLVYQSSRGRWSSTDLHLYWMGDITFIRGGLRT
ncbi:uncharacterized protein OCT59_026778 [Rhizophagus irregularis]|uniref:uncharacterized protein n=1 Tax=Rhizophagus irregularis TaxID=588596 RepID=UPI0019DE10C7|nr:hypothetical protein OCT59_026778 [Rhizophagus irregularis]GBC16329.2 hypothetical protein RIR_jg32183.t1 [Rhizophagus irregularis DAOM 181602=DAOM 197198]CAB4491295.1 unnamed protein product [Rhizophagus irregularis]